VSRRPPSQQTPTIHPLLEQAVGEHRAGRMAEAVEIYERIIAQIPNHFDATHLLGVLALQDGRLERAQDLITSALRTNPKDFAALNNLGMVFLRKGELDLAKRQFENAVKVQPNFFDGLANLGTVLRQMDLPREALVPLRRAHSDNPQSAMVCNLIGACLMDTGEVHAAAKFFEAATLAEPQEADGWSNLAIALSGVGELGRARDCADKAVEMRPESSAALAARAAVEFGEGLFEAAIQTYAEAIALPNPSTQTYCASASALWTSGRCEEALDHLRKAVAIDGNNAIARWKLAMTECRSYYDALAEVEASRKVFTDSVESLQAWFNAGRRLEAFRAVGSTQPFYLAYALVSGHTFQIYAGA
jgi:protein O-GlcNAc transferase